MKNNEKTQKLILANTVSKREIFTGQEVGSLRISQLRGKLILLTPFDLVIVVFCKITNLDSPLWLNGLYPVLPWKIENLRPLADPADTDPALKYYELGLDKKLLFHREDVLNHQFGNHFLKSEKTLGGYSLWTGDAPIPSDFPHAALIPANMVFVNSLGNQQLMSFEVVVDARGHYIAPWQTRARNITGKILEEAI